jgi:hypothetical protein
MTAGKHEDPRHLVVVHAQGGDPLDRLDLHDNFSLAVEFGGKLATYRVTGWDELPGGFRKLYCEMVWERQPGASAIS